jgi:DNA polymerase IV
MGASTASILHADLDAFYASVEQLLDPSLRGRPVAVGGGVVLAASYEAKAFGVSAGMAGWRARSLCPDLVFASGHFSEYQRLGDQFTEVMKDFTPHVERISIDEAFMDVGGSVHLFGPAEAIAESLRGRVLTELGLPVSVGVARTKHLAKIASQVAKPDGLVVVPTDRESQFLSPLPVGLIWGVGAATRARLAARGIHTIGQLAAIEKKSLQAVLGKSAGSKLSDLASNLDPRPVRPGRRAVSVGAQSAMGRRPATVDAAAVTVDYLADRIAARLRKAGRAGRTISVRVRFVELRSVSRAVTLRHAVATTKAISETALELVGVALSENPDEREITLVGLSVSRLVDEPPIQLVLPFAPSPGRLRAITAGEDLRRALDDSMDDLRQRFGRSAVGYAAVALGDVSRVPDEFRALAEHDPGG